MDFKQCKIAVGNPQPEQTDFRFNRSLSELLMHSSGYIGSLAWMGIVGCRVAHNRNKIVESALEGDFTHILWIDSDSQFPIHGLVQLLRHDKDIVGATTCKRDGSDGLPLIDLLIPDEPVEGILAPVKNIGFPFMLTKTEVFRKMEAPWFAEPPVRLMKQAYPELNLDQADDDILGEDIYFCAMARRAGYELWCDLDLSLQIGHIGSRVHYIDVDIRASAPVDVKLVA